jgi:triosephosphate isomerase (TIM)
MRKPLMAGNWKMNLNHLEAIAVAQKLVYSLSDKDYDAVDCDHPAIYRYSFNPNYG